MIGAVRARDAAVNGDILVLREASFRTRALALNEFAAVRDSVNAAWIAGIHYREELLNADGSDGRLERNARDETQERRETRI